MLKQEAEAEAQFIASTGKLEQQHSANVTLLQQQLQQVQGTLLDDQQTKLAAEEQIRKLKDQLLKSECQAKQAQENSLDDKRKIFKRCQLTKTHWVFE